MSKTPQVSTSQRGLELTEDIRRFVKHLVPHDSTIHGVSFPGPYTMKIDYTTAGGKHARHEIVTWSATSTEEA